MEWWGVELGYSKKGVVSSYTVFMRNPSIRDLQLGAHNTFTWEILQISKLFHLFVVQHKFYYF